MAREITRKRLFFTTKEIWFAPEPYDIDGVAMAFFQGCERKVDTPGFQRKAALTFMIDLSQDLDTIWNKFSGANVHKEIRRAERAGVVILRNERYEEFYRLYTAVRVQKGLSEPISLDIIKKYGTLFVAEYKGQVISARVYVEDAEHIRSWVSGSARFESKDTALVGNAGRLMVWEAIRYAKDKGIRWFDFGGYNAGGMHGEVLDQPNWFKKSFGGEVVTVYEYKKVYSKAYIYARKMYDAVGLRKLLLSIKHVVLRK